MKKLLISLVSLMVIYSCSHKKTKIDLVSRPDTNEYWNTLSEFIARDEDNGLHHYLSSYNPALLNQIENDSKDPYLLMFWGQSSNEDASNNKTIVDEKVLNQINKKFNYHQNNKVSHAGIIHSYGYMFSRLMTPYGYKRKRWLDRTLNYAFSFTDESLSPQTKSGSLLSNITYFIGMISLTNKTKLELLKNVSTEVRRFNYESLHVSTLTEKVDHMTIKTFFVHFPKILPNDENRYLLIYTLEDSRLKNEQLITAFPVNEGMVKAAQKTSELGLNKKVTLRYNAFYEAFPLNVLGSRVFIKKR